jgi:hypothetical protein
MSAPIPASDDPTPDEQNSVQERVWTPGDRENDGGIGGSGGKSDQHDNDA